LTVLGVALLGAVTALLVGNASPALGYACEIAVFTVACLRPRRVSLTAALVSRGALRRGQEWRQRVDHCGRDADRGGMDCTGVRRWSRGSRNIRVGSCAKPHAGAVVGARFAGRS
jgi:hypothetical protein